MKIKHGADYRAERAKAYPPLGDFADALYHHLHKGDSSKIEAYFAEVEAVKQKFKKPDKPPAN